MRRIAIIQARMGSSRLPGKVLEDIGGEPMIARVIERLRMCPELDDVVVATTTGPEDEPLIEAVRRCGARWHRGSSDDVLGRFEAAARETEADVIVRVTGDCPLIDPAVVTRVIVALGEDALADYAANVLERTFPRGLDVEALHADCLRRVDRVARSKAAREHVTWFIYRERPDLFTTRSVVDRSDNSDLRWTVDTPADLDLIRRLYSQLGLASRHRPYAEVVEHVRAHPELLLVNATVEQRQP
jgi:spore coat polysaccharide biosynthesis protein SpsF